MKKILLDTQAFVWFAENSSKLSAKARKAFLDTGNQLFLSVATIWELSIKTALRKLILEQDLRTLVLEGISRNQIELVSIEAEHAFRVKELPLFHRDPFDRLIIAQAIEEQMLIMSNDHEFDRYEVTRIW